MLNADALRLFGVRPGMQLLAQRAAAYATSREFVAWLRGVAEGRAPDVEGDAYSVRGAATWLLERMRVMAQYVCDGEAEWPDRAGTVVGTVEEAQAVMGLLYAAREWDQLKRFVAVDDAVLPVLVGNEPRAVNAFVAVIRSFTAGAVVVVNEVPDPRKPLQHPAIVAPHKSWDREHYLVFIQGERVAKIRRDEVAKLAGPIEPGDCGCSEPSEQPPANAGQTSDVRPSNTVTVGEAETRLALLEEQVEALRRENAELRARLEELAEENARLRRQLAEKVEKIEDLLGRVLVDAFVYDARAGAWRVKLDGDAVARAVEDAVRRAVEERLREAVEEAVKSRLQEVAEAVAAEVISRVKSWLAQFEEWVREQLQRR